MYVCFWILFLQKPSDFLNIWLMFGVVKYQGSLCSLREKLLCIMEQKVENGESWKTIWIKEFQNWMMLQ